jgi:hypothetical protein
MVHGMLRCRRGRTTTERKLHCPRYYSKSSRMTQSRVRRTTSSPTGSSHRRRRRRRRGGRCVAVIIVVTSPWLRGCRFAARLHRHCGYGRAGLTSAPWRGGGVGMCARGYHEGLD